MKHDTIIDGFKLGSDGAWIQSTQSNLTEDEKVKTSDNNIFTKK